MKPETYFKKYGCIYGISYKDGEENGYSVRFTSLDDAREWLHTEEYDFRTRELCGKTEALKYGEPSEMVRVDEVVPYTAGETVSELWTV